MTTKIEPWIKLAAEHIENAYTVAIQKQVAGIEPAVVKVAYIIAAHAPNHEWEAKEKALRWLAIKMSCVAHNSVVYAHEIEAILNSGEQP